MKSFRLFTIADNSIRGSKHKKYFFLVNSPFLLPFCLTLAFVCAQLDTGLEIFQLISGQKVCHYLDGDKGGEESRKTVTNGDKGGRGTQKSGFLL